MNLIHFAMGLRERIRVVMQLANANAIVVQSKLKLWYGKHTKNVPFEKG